MGGNPGEEKPGGAREWIMPFAFAFCAGWVIWHGPAYILDFFPHESMSMTAQITELHQRKDITSALPGLFGGKMDIIDYAALILTPIIFLLGIRNIVHAPMEFPHVRASDMFALFIGRVTMILIISMTMVMLYEVFLRYVVEAPTLWANELTLWIAGFVFLLSGLYAMQQRCHIRIFILYDILPKTGQRICDVTSVLLLCAFAFFLVFGSFKQVFLIKFHRWEMFGTAFDPPIPATIQPMILIVVCLVAIQAIVNLILDWNYDPTEIKDADTPSADEVEAMKKA